MRIRLLAAALILIALLDSTGCACHRHFRRCRRFRCCEPCCASCELGTPCALHAPCGCDGTTFYPPAADGPPHLGGDPVMSNGPIMPLPANGMPSP